VLEVRAGLFGRKLLITSTTLPRLPPEEPGIGLNDPPRLLSD
jgi:hypothetical protein